MMKTSFLTIPLEVEALVIEAKTQGKPSQVITEAQSSLTQPSRFCWSPQRKDYRLSARTLEEPLPLPFWQASNKVQGKSVPYLTPLAENLPRYRDQGIYLRWLLPTGLLKSHRPNELSFLGIPDQWLIVRRLSAPQVAPQSEAWIVDSAALLEPSEASAFKQGSSLLNAQFEACQVGRVTPLTQAQYQPQAPRLALNALGTLQTSSVSFSHHLSENQQVLSWKDPLNALPAAYAQKRSQLVVSYAVFGWYREPAADLLRALPVLCQKPQMTLAEVLQELGWKAPLTPEQASPSWLQQATSLFHGMTAHINYWNPERYFGGMLGAPGAPLAHGDIAYQTPEPFRLAIGQSLTDALLALVTRQASQPQANSVSAFSPKPSAPETFRFFELDQVLKALAYRQTAALLKYEPPLEQIRRVHQDSFYSIQGGRRYTWIKPQASPATKQVPSPFSAFPIPPEPPAELSFATRQALASLNQSQALLDQKARDFNLLQHEFYAAWWQFIRSVRVQEDDETQRKACLQLKQTLDSVFQKLAEARTEIDSKPLETRLKQEGWELTVQEASRFWSPADPFISIQNFGALRHSAWVDAPQCRVNHEWGKRAEVLIEGQWQEAPLVTEQELGPIRAGLQRYFQPLTQNLAESRLAAHVQDLPEALCHLLQEAWTLEGALQTLAEASFPQEPQKQQQTWLNWIDYLRESLLPEEASEPSEEAFEPSEEAFEPFEEDSRPLRLWNAQKAPVNPQAVGQLWGQQPWSPRFLDWEIEWTPISSQEFQEFWQFNPQQQDYELKKKPSQPPFLIRGRSFMQPGNREFFEEALTQLERLMNQVEQTQEDPLAPELQAIFRHYRGSWTKALQQLRQEGLTQPLSGLHQILIKRHVQRMRIEPNPAKPWNTSPHYAELNDSEVARLLQHLPELPGGLPWQPPNSEPKPAWVFDWLRSGVWQLKNLWAIDDFGQWLDLLQPQRGSAGLLSISPHLQVAPETPEVRMPPRFYQPLRLHFRWFTQGLQPAILGWIYAHPLHQSLAVCDPQGHLLGELTIVPHSPKQKKVVWEALNLPPYSLEDPAHQELKQFVEALQEAPGQNPKLEQLLALAENAFKPGLHNSLSQHWLAGPPMMLVKAQIGFELFGRPWRAPYSFPEVSTDPLKDTFPVQLGLAEHPHEGLVGYFPFGDFGQIIPVQAPGDAGSYLKSETLLKVGFDGPETLTLLIYPQGILQAVCGLTPVKQLTMPPEWTKSVLERLECSLRVSPALLAPGFCDLPVAPAGHNRWIFVPSPGGSSQEIQKNDTYPHFERAPFQVVEGRLFLRQTPANLASGGQS